MSNPLTSTRRPSTRADAAEHHPRRVRRADRHRPRRVALVLGRHARLRASATRTTKRCTCEGTRRPPTTRSCCARAGRPQQRAWPTACGARPTSTVAEAWFGASGADLERRPAGATRGVGEAVRVRGPARLHGRVLPRHPCRRLLPALRSAPWGAIARIDHFNICVDDVTAAYDYFESLGFRCSETIEDERSRCSAPGCIASRACTTSRFTVGTSPRLHHVGFFAPESHNISAAVRPFGAIDEQDHIERGPGRHGVSNAFYVYLRDPDGHRLEIYTSDYFTGDPDDETFRWNVNDVRRRDFWGAAVVPSWYAESADRARPRRQRRAGATPSIPSDRSQGRRRRISLTRCPPATSHPSTCHTRNRHILSNQQLIWRVPMALLPHHADHVGSLLRPSTSRRSAVVARRPACRPRRCLRSRTSAITELVAHQEAVGMRRRHRRRVPSRLVAPRLPRRASTGSVRHSASGRRTSPGSARARRFRWSPARSTTPPDLRRCLLLPRRRDHQGDPEDHDPGSGHGQLDGRPAR